MREIKFRAWDKKTNEMYVADSIGWNCVTQKIEHVNIVNQNDSVWIGLDEDELDNIVLMQSTGLKDKNGVEIYEGDIIKLFNKKIFKIEWRESEDIGCNGGEYYFSISGFIPVKLDGTVDNQGECECAYSEMVEKEVKVIGNIYENPELLGKE